MKRDLFIVLLSVAHVMVAASVQWNKIKSDGGDGLGGHYLRVDYRLESPQTILRSGSLSLGLESTPLNGKEFSVFCAVLRSVPGAADTAVCSAWRSQLLNAPHCRSVHRLGF